MPIDNLQERLEAVAADFGDAEPDSGSMFAPPPEGYYLTLVHEFDWFDGGEPKQAWMKVRLLVQSDEDGDRTHGGRFCEKLYAIEDKDKFGRIKADMELLGAEELAQKIHGRPLAILDLMPNTDVIRGMLDTPVKVRVKDGKNIDPATGKPYRNTFIEERLGPPGSGGVEFTPRSDVPDDGDFGPPAVPQGTLDDDIPF